MVIKYIVGLQKTSTMSTWIEIPAYIVWAVWIFQEEPNLKNVGQEALQVNTGLFFPINGMPLQCH